VQQINRNHHLFLALRYLKAMKRSQLIFEMLIQVVVKYEQQQLEVQEGQL
jgi:hypothetical protein